MSNTMRRYANFEEVAKHLDGRASRRIGNNTTLHVMAGMCDAPYQIGVALHDTNILVFGPLGVQYNTGGWTTVTTKSRFNDCGLQCLYIYQEDWNWYVHRVVPGVSRRECDGLDLLFQSGMVFDYSGNYMGNGIWRAVRETEFRVDNNGTPAIR